MLLSRTLSSRSALLSTSSCLGWTSGGVCAGEDVSSKPQRRRSPGASHCPDAVAEGNPMRSSRERPTVPAAPHPPSLPLSPAHVFAAGFGVCGILTGTRGPEPLLCPRLPARSLLLQPWLPWLSPDRCPFFGGANKLELARKYSLLSRHKKDTCVGMMLFCF